MNDLIDQPAVQQPSIADLRLERDARLTTIQPASYHAMSEEAVAAWRETQISCEIVRGGATPIVAALIDHVLAAVDQAALQCTKVAIVQLDDIRPSITPFSIDDVVLNVSSIDFGGISIHLHDTQCQTHDLDWIEIGENREHAVLLHASIDEACKLHDQLRERLNLWRSSGETLLVSIDGAMSKKPSDEVWAIGLSFSTDETKIDLEQLSSIFESYGDSMSRPVTEITLMTSDGHVVSIAPVSTIDPTDAGSLESLSKMLNANFQSIFQRLSVREDVGRSAIRVAGVKRVVVQARDLAPMCRAYALIDADRDHDAEGTFVAPVYEEGAMIDVLVWEPKSDVDALDLTRAAWAGYVLSLKASEDLGLNDRCHVPAGGFVEAARAHVDAIGAVATPHDCVYGSDMSYWELSKVTFDAETGTLAIVPQLGS
jgi:hypothetical protein